MRKCKYCHSPIQGGSDKMFCDSQCRNSFNNKKKRKNEKLIHDINKILRKNRKILKQFNPEGKTTIRKEYLLKMDFNFNYHTHTFTTANKNVYRFCYEYGYLTLENDKILIINEQAYMKKN